MTKVEKIDIKNYKEIKGFYDLRKFQLSKKVFKKLWYIQLFLKEQSLKADYLKKFEPIQYEKLKQLSADYQQILLNMPLK